MSHPRRDESQDAQRHEEDIAHHPYSKEAQAEDAEQDDADE